VSYSLGKPRKRKVGLLLWVEDDLGDMNEMMWHGKTNPGIILTNISLFEYFQICGMIIFLHNLKLQKSKGFFSVSVP
jgi:hypothetical protein